MSRRVIVLGLDGVCWDLIGGWIDGGELPTFRRLRDGYAHGTLKSVVIPLTFLAWPSMFTGKNPGKHGIVCIGEFSKKIYGFSHFNCAKDVKSDFLWEILEKNGLKCGIINIPLSSPFRSEISFGEGDKWRKDWMNFEWKEDTRVGLLPSNKNFGKRVNEIIELRFDQLEHVLEKREFDFFGMDICSLDPLQHFKWHDKEFLKGTFKRIDSRLDQLLKKLDNEIMLFIISDHGMIGLEKWLRVNNWLAEKGYLRFKGEIKSSRIARAGINTDSLESVSNPVISIIAKLGLKRFIPRQVIESFRKFRGHRLLLNDEVTAKELVDQIDWENTRAHAFGGEGSIYLNLKDREVYGSVSKKEYEKVREAIIKDLKEDFKGIEIFRREDVYDGPYVDSAADIMFVIDGGSIRTSGSYSPSGALFKEPVPGKGVMSNHSLQGMFLTYGKEFRKVKVDPVIYDITPTVLHTFGLSVPKDMDGKVLKEIFREDSELARREVVHKKADEKGWIRSRIRKLGL